MSRNNTRTLGSVFALSRMQLTCLAIGSALFFAWRVESADKACAPTTSLVPLPQLSEASGLTMSRRTPGLLWAHNDSGAPVLLALTTAGVVKGSVRVTGAEVDDWEDITAGACPGGSCLYIADIGDNSRTRRQIRIYRVAEPAAEDSATKPAETFDAAYPDGAHDAEAMFVTREGRLFLVTKDDPASTALYRFPHPLHTGTTMKLERVSSGVGQFGKDERGSRITDADASPDGAWVALRTIEELRVFRTKDLLRGTGSPALVADLSGLREPRGEGVTMAADGTVYLVSEGGGGGRPGTFLRLRCSLGN